MSDFLGPADAPNSVTVRPTEARTFGNADSWFKDCTSPVLEDGTDIQANWLNGIIAALRSIWRVNGKLADNVTDVNPEVGTDDGGLAKALLHLIQRAQQSYAVDTGVANAIAVSFTPAPPELKAGMHFRVKVKVANTGATTVEVNGGPAIALKHPNGAAMAAGDLLANGIAVIVYDGTVFQLIASHTDQTGGGGGGGTTFRVPIANAGGTATAITATYTPTTASPVAGDRRRRREGRTDRQRRSEGRGDYHCEGRSRVGTVASGGNCKVCGKAFRSVERERPGINREVVA